jgi:hypothetical protein
MVDAQQGVIHEAKEQLQQLPDWSILSRDQQNQLLGQVEQLILHASADLVGFQQLLAQEYVIQSTTRTLKQQVERLAHERRNNVRDKDNDSSPTPTKFTLPARLRNVDDLTQVVKELQALSTQLARNEEILLVVR